MSEIRANTVSNAAGTGPVTLTGQYAAKVWGSLDQDTTGHPVYDSFNVSSTTDNSLGETTVAYINSMSNADYAVSGAAQSEFESASSFSIYGKASGGNTASDFRIDIRDSTGGNRDCQYVSFSIDGDLA